MQTRKLISVLLLALAAISARAIEDYRVGLCDNTLPMNDKMISINRSKSVDLAICLSPELLSNFEGRTINGINIGFNSTHNVASVKGWLRHEQDAENIAETEEISVDGLNQGWNTLPFQIPVTLEADKKYFVGYTISLANASTYFFLPAQEGGEPDAFFMKVGEEKWLDLPSETLNIELLLSAENTPANEAQLLSASIKEPYILNGNPFTVRYKLQNAGTESLKSYTLTLSDENNGISQSFHSHNDLPYNNRKEFEQSFTLNGLSPEKIYNFRLSISDPNGETMTSKCTTAVIPEIASIAGLFNRTTLIEEFSTEKCSQCPAAARKLESVYSSLSPDEKERVAIVGHHAGYGTDNFTLQCDESLLWFYNSGAYTYCPAIMFDRSSRGETPVSTVDSSLKSDVLTNLNKDAYYKIAAFGVHDEQSRAVDISIVGKAAFNYFNNPLITVYIVENNVKAFNQVAGGNGYSHNHILRAYSSVWGEAPMWSDRFNYSFKTRLSYPDGCKVEDMEIVAFIANYDETNPNNCEVGNACKINLSDLKETGLNPISSDKLLKNTILVKSGKIIVVGEYDAIEIYDMFGNIISGGKLLAGIYIVRIHNNSEITAEKVFVK